MALTNDRLEALINIFHERRLKHDNQFLKEVQECLVELWALRNSIDAANAVVSSSKPSTPSDIKAITSFLVRCVRCDKDTEHSHWHDCAHGIVGTHMSGSERWRCDSCGLATFANGENAERFQFTLDKDKDKDKGKDNAAIG